MSNFGTGGLTGTPPVVKNLLIINFLIFFLTYVVFGANEKEITNLFALHYFRSDYFHWWQFITHMFMHAGLNQLDHILFNMFGLWMFGRVLEEVWGGKRFLIYYMVTGIGAALFYTFINYLSFSGIETAITAFANTPSPDLYDSIVHKYFGTVYSANIDFINNWRSNTGNPEFANIAISNLKEGYLSLISTPTVGASGAIFGILLGFGMLFPNTPLYLFFIPIPIKAKYVVIGYGAIELFSGLTQTNSNIAHFAHLGGMLFGFILIKYWNTKRNTFY
jgi:membrane associated rhomboid family serine protease